MAKNDCSFLSPWRGEAKNSKRRQHNGSGYQHWRASLTLLHRARKARRYLRIARALCACGSRVRAFQQRTWRQVSGGGGKANGGARSGRRRRRHHISDVLRKTVNHLYSDVVSCWTCSGVAHHVASRSLASCAAAYSTPRCWVHAADINAHLSPGGMRFVGGAPLASCAVKITRTRALFAMRHCCIYRTRRWYLTSFRLRGISACAAS